MPELDLGGSLKLDPAVIGSSMPPSPDAPNHEGIRAIASSSEASLDPRSPITLSAEANQSENGTLKPLPMQWLSILMQHSHLPTALLEPQSLRIQFANPRFCQTVGIAERAIAANHSADIYLLEMLLPDEQTRIQQVLQFHLLKAILAHLYPQRLLLSPRLLDEPIMLTASQHK
ncbi:MAG: hypothetical protein F6K04_27815, partial [Leptolyngbya sp. SIO4C5]|nr:hypothetical protein [Leptolyngbya sp. SIO4C5]